MLGYFRIMEILKWKLLQYIGVVLGHLVIIPTGQDSKDLCRDGNKMRL